MQVFKNVLIALLISALILQTDSYTEVANVLTLLSMAAVLFFALAAIEDAVDRYKDRRYRRRRLSKEIENIHIPRGGTYERKV